MIIERDGACLYELFQDGHNEDGSPNIVRRWYAVVCPWHSKCSDAETEQIAALLQMAPALKAACETLLACNREKDPGTGLALLHEAVEQARAALKLCEVQQ